MSPTGDATLFRIRLEREPRRHLAEFRHPCELWMPAARLRVWARCASYLGCLARASPFPESFFYQNSNSNKQLPFSNCFSRVFDFFLFFLFRALWLRINAEGAYPYGEHCVWGIVAAVVRFFFFFYVSIGKMFIFYSPASLSKRCIGSIGKVCRTYSQLSIMAVKNVL